MLQIGKMNTLTVVEIEERGAWLAAGEYGELLLPRRQLPEGVAEESEVWCRLETEGFGELQSGTSAPRRLPPLDGSAYALEGLVGGCS